MSVPDLQALPIQDNYHDVKKHQQKSLRR